MNFRALWSRLWKAKKTEEETTLPSIVLLLRESHFFTKPELEIVAGKGWQQRFHDADDSKYFVVQQGPVSILKADRYLAQVLQAHRPYLDDVEAIAKLHQKEELRKAWREHTAWVSVDIFNADLDTREAHAVLARFTKYMVDTNCSGIYLPSMQLMLPNDGLAEQFIEFLLQQEGSFRL